jgi:NTE family protein
VSERPRVALVVGSGGMKCAAAVGLWKVLEREGIPLDLVVGCSGGSIYTAAMALGMPTSEAERHTLVMWDGLFERWSYRALLHNLFSRWTGFDERRAGLVDDRAVASVMRALYGDATFEDTRIPLRIAATDLHTGERVEISSGRVADAVRASISLPVVLRPWLVDGRVLVDGGASDPLPVSIAIREGADIILAMGFETPPKDRLTSILGVASQTSSIAVNHLLRATYAFYSAVHHAEIVPIMPTFDQKIGLGDTHLLPYIMEEGARAMEAELPYLHRILAAGTARAATGS